MSYVLQNDLYGRNKEVLALKRLREFCPSEGYYVAFSGGKDSVVIKDLCKRAGVKHDTHYSLTTVDPPELVHFIRRQHPDVEVVRPDVPLFQAIVKRGFPTRWSRWCCEYLKEESSKNRVTVTGVRWEESARRRARPIVEICSRRGIRLVNPIVDWTTAEVWTYIHGRGLPYCKLYDEGFKRLGCVMCPLLSLDDALIEAARWPKIAAGWRRAFDRLYECRAGMPSVSQWANGTEMYEWWMTVGRSGNPNRQPECQQGLFI